jgi:uncharacterized membrane protein
MINLTFYYDPNNENCRNVLLNLENLQQELEFHLTKIDVTRDREIYNDFQQLPTIKVGPYTLQGEITIQQLRIAINAAIDRDINLRKLGDKGYEGKIDRGRKVSNSDLITYFISKHYMVLFNFVMFLYVGLPFLAPVLMNADIEFPAQIIYKIYRPLCHQLTFRSFFLFGDQLYYPRALADIEGVTSYEEYFHQDQLDVQFARNFLGDEKTGYKVALCERDIGIYGSFLLFGIVFHLSGRRIRKIPWYVWFILGILPMGLDGTSQLPGMISSILPAWIPIRESTPFLRVLTGVLFGVTTAWYLYPMVEENMKDARVLISQKKSYIQQNHPDA